MSDAAPTQNGLKQGDASSSLHINFALEYVIRKAQENRERMAMNGKHQFLVDVDDVNMLDEYICHTEKRRGSVTGY
jgi:hypothetical protein